VLEDTNTTFEIKQALFKKFGATHGIPPPEEMRLRMASGTGTPGGVKMTQVFTDGANLAAVYGKKISDGKMLAVQQCPAGDFFTTDHILLGVRHWSPVNQVLGLVREIGVMRSSSYSEFQEQLAPLLGDTFEPSDVIIIKPFAYLLKDVSNMSTLKWPNLRADQKLTDAPMRIKDGDTVVFKNRHEKEMEVLPSEASATAAPRAAPSDGPAFTIFTPSQQFEREESRRADEKAREEEERERTEAIRARISSATAKAAFE